MRALVAALCVAILGAVTWAVAPSIAQSTFPNPVATQTTLGTVAVQVIGQNPSRRSVRICNVGATNAVTVWSGALTPPKTQDILAPVTSNVVACHTPPSGVVGSNGAQWNAIINGGSSGSVTVEEW